MPAKRKYQKKGNATPKNSRRPPLGISVQRSHDGSEWMLDHPRCVRQRAEDLEEVRTMIENGETDVAIDELRWLVDGCREFIDAHRMLGELVLSADDDVALARGHYGFAYQLGLTALRRARNPTPLPYRLPANQAFFEAGKGLAWCLNKLDKTEMAIETVEQMLACDPTGPLGLKDVLAKLRDA